MKNLSLLIICLFFSSIAAASTAQIVNASNYKIVVSYGICAGSGPAESCSYKALTPIEKKSVFTVDYGDASGVVIYAASKHQDNKVIPAYYDNLSCKAEDGISAILYDYDIPITNGGMIYCSKAEAHT